MNNIKKIENNFYKIARVSMFAYWFPGIALLVMLYRCVGTRIFDNFFVLLLTLILCVLLSMCWLSLSFFLFSLARNLTWYYYGYKKCFWLCFPFVYSRQNGIHLLSNTLTYNSLLFDGIPEDFVVEQVEKYEAERNHMCAVCERNAMIVYSVLNVILAGIVVIDYSWILVLLAIWVQTIIMYIMDAPEYKGVYTKYMDYKSDDAIFYLAKAAAYQGMLEGNLRTELLVQAERSEAYTRFEFYLYKSLRVQCTYMALSGGVDKELFEYLENKDIISNVNVIVNATGQERLECLKVLADSAVLNDNQEQKDILYRNFVKLDMEFVQNTGETLFDIWRKMLRDETVDREINHKFDQTKQILSNSDIYNRKIYKEYDKTWKQLKKCLEKKNGK